jgi:hypothetical protein
MVTTGESLKTELMLSRYVPRKWRQLGDATMQDDATRTMSVRWTVSVATSTLVVPGLFSTCASIATDQLQLRPCPPGQGSNLIARWDYPPRVRLIT